ncbi:MAG: hypothetical protein HWE25_15010 [Alphaproteobacteria bacterium]|nr:hypothetical protein [Alphaproteobacteria bacterium]
MTRYLTLALACTLLGSVSVQGADCGEPPMAQPNVPEGSVANADQIRDARDAVLAYSQSVDKYLTCMDQRASKLMPYLTKDQQARWDEDLTAVHERRRDLQIKMNEAIRSYRRSRQS